jgi:hypothetical protein
MARFCRALRHVFAQRSAGDEHPKGKPVPSLLSLLCDAEDSNPNFRYLNNRISSNYKRVHVSCLPNSVLLHAPPETSTQKVSPSLLCFPCCATPRTQTLTLDILIIRSHLITSVYMYHAYQIQFCCKMLSGVHMFTHVLSLDPPLQLLLFCWLVL